MRKAYLLLLAAFIPAQTLALSAGTLHQVQFDAVYYSDVSTTCTVVVDVNLSGNDNVQKAFNYFVSKGLTGQQSAGIVGNLVQEHGVQTSDTAGGYGIAQWIGSRRQNLIDFAKQQGKSADDLGVQLDFLWQELNSSYSSTLHNLQAATTIDDAENQFVGPINFNTKQPATPTEEVRRTGGFENPGKPLVAKRIAYAHKAFDMFGAGGAAAPSTPSTASAGCGGIVGTGQNTQFVDGFTFYDQYDPSWKNLPYGTSTIGDSGCGPTAMAMIITMLAGTSVTPVETANYAASLGLYVDGVGSDHLIAPKLAEHWGLKATPVGTDAAKISATLQSGGLVIISGHGPLPYTDKGHYIVIRGITAGGKLKIADPAVGAADHKDDNTKEWDVSQILGSNASADSAYAITKAATP